MNWIDALIAIIVLSFTFLGLRNGLIREAFSLAGIVLGILVATRYGDTLVSLFGPRASELPSAIVFAVIIVAVAALFIWLGHLLHRVAKALFLGWADRIFGSVFGFAKGLLLASLLLIILSLFSFFPALGDKIQSSALAPKVIKVAPATYNLLSGSQVSEDLNIKRWLEKFLQNSEVQGEPVKDSPGKETEKK
jgi:membrane protein required for colicin V production